MKSNSVEFYMGDSFDRSKLYCDDSVQTFAFSCADAALSNATSSACSIDSTAVKSVQGTSGAIYSVSDKIKELDEQFKVLSEKMDNYLKKSSSLREGLKTLKIGTAAR